MPSLDEDGEEAQSSSAPETKAGASQPLQHIPSPSDDDDDASTKDGPVAHARAQRRDVKGKTKGGDDMTKQDGLKLRLELNLDIELELKASIRGDVTLALL